MSLAIKLVQRFLLSLNEFVNIFHTGRSNLPGGGHHDSVQKLNVRLQLVAISVAFPVEVHLDCNFRDPGDELFMLLDESGQQIVFLLSLRLGSLSHQNLAHLSQPLLDLHLLQVLAESLNKRGVTLCLV